ncbi:MAG: hypothetical protein U0R67_04495 [Micropruina glycogenica]
MLVTASPVSPITSVAASVSTPPSVPRTGPAPRRRYSSTVPPSLRAGSRTPTGQRGVAVAGPEPPSANSITPPPGWSNMVGGPRPAPGDNGVIADAGE